MAATIAAETPGGQVVASTSSGPDGSYAVTLPPGSYTLVVTGPSTFPRCPATPAVVSAGAVTTVDISCDTGIR